MTYALHSSALGLAPSLPPNSSRQLLPHLEEEDSEQDEEEPSSSYRPLTANRLSKSTSRRALPSSRSSSTATARLTKRPPPSTPHHVPSSMGKLTKKRASSGSSVFGGGRHIFKSSSSHPDHPNAEEILHMIDPTFYSSMTPSSSPPTTHSRLADLNNYDYPSESQYPSSSSHYPDLTRPYTDAEGQLHDPNFRMFDIEIAPHALRARQSRSSSMNSSGLSYSRMSVPGPGYDYGTTGRPTRRISNSSFDPTPVSSGKGRGRSKTSNSDGGRPASYDPLLSPTMQTLASWDELIEGEPGYESPGYDSESGMVDPRDMVMPSSRVHVVDAPRTDSGYTNSPSSPQPTSLVGGGGSSSSAVRDENGMSHLEREEAEFRNEPWRTSVVALRRPPRERNDARNGFGTSSLYSPPPEEEDEQQQRPSASSSFQDARGTRAQIPTLALQTPTTAASESSGTAPPSRRNSRSSIKLDDMPPSSGPGSRRSSTYRPQPARELSRSTVYPRPVTNTSFPAAPSRSDSMHFGTRSVSHMSLPVLPAPPNGRPASVSSDSEPSDDEFAYERQLWEAERKRKKKSVVDAVPRTSVMGAPEGYVNDPDSPFRPVIVQPVEDESVYGVKRGRKTHTTPSSASAAPKGVVPGLLLPSTAKSRSKSTNKSKSRSHNSSRASSPGPDPLPRPHSSAYGPVQDAAAATSARARAKREELKRELWHSDRAYQPGDLGLESATKKKTKKNQQSTQAMNGVTLGATAAVSEKLLSHVADHSMHVPPNGAPYWYPEEEEQAVGVVARSVTDEVGDFVRSPISEKPRPAPRASSHGISVSEPIHAARSTSGGLQYVPSHHGKSVSLRPGVEIIDDDYAPGCMDGLRRSWQSFKLSLRFGAFRTRKRIERKVASMKS